MASHRFLHTGRTLSAVALAVATVLMLSSCSNDEASASTLCDSLDAVNVALAKLQTASTSGSSTGLPEAVIELDAATRSLIAEAPDSAASQASAVKKSATTLRDDTRAFISDLEQSIGIRIASKYQPNVASLGQEDLIRLQDELAGVLGDADDLGSAMEALTSAVGSECSPSPAAS
jgi:hypothetical protein